MVHFRKNLEDFETYKIEKIVSHNLGDNENRLIDWSGLLEEAVQEIALSDLLYYGDNQYRELLEAYEKQLGEAEGRERIKVVERETMTAISRDEPHDGKLY